MLSAKVQVSREAKKTREPCVHVGQGQLRMSRDYRVRCHAEMLGRGRSLATLTTVAVTTGLGLVSSK